MGHRAYCASCSAKVEVDAAWVADKTQGLVARYYETGADDEDDYDQAGDLPLAFSAYRVDEHPAGRCRCGATTVLVLRLRPGSV